jgi:iron complex outermembrane recepter protein
MFSQKAIVLMCGCLIYFSATAQETCSASLSGSVQSNSGEALPGATISIDSIGRAAASDGQGRFLFENICDGRYTLVVHFIGYKRQLVKVDVTGMTQSTIILQPDVTELAEVLVQDKPLHTEHAQNFTALNQKQLDESSGKSLGEMLKEVPGVNSIQAGPGIFKPVIHGVHSNRILILNYGIRQEGQQWGAEHAPEIDPFVASNIVVIKDASAIKYGTDALGGVIVINPPPLPETAGLGGSINSGVQSNGRSGTFSGMLQGGIKGHEGWGWRMQGTARRAGDFHAPDYSLTNTGVKELNFSASTGYHSEHKGIEVYFSHFKTELGILKGTSISNMDDLLAAMERTPPQYTTDFSYNISEPRQEVSHNLIKINGHIHSNFGEWRLQYGFQNNNRQEYDMRIGSLSSIPSIDLQLNTHTIEAEVERNKSEKITTCFGVTGMLQENNNIPGTQRIPFIPDFNNISAGVFGISKFFFKNLTVDAGARYDYRSYAVAGYDFKNTLYKTNFRFHNASAAVGATLAFKKRQTLNMSISSAWRPPHVAELYSLGTHQSAAAIEYGLLLNDSTNEVMDIDDVSFKIEQALKWVGSYQREWSKVTLDVTVYANYIFNYIYLKPTGITQNVRGLYPYFRYTQTDALFLGADFSATWQVNDHLKVIPKATVLRASDQTNNDYLVFIPANRLEVALRYESPKFLSFKNFYAESKVKFIAKQHRAPRTITVRDFNDAIESETDPLQGSSSNFDFMDAPNAYWLWNMTVGLSVQGTKARYDFRLGSENTLNTTYREYTNRFRYYADDLGTNFIFSIKCTF